MVRQTRASAKSDSDVSDESVIADIPRKGPPPSDASYERKFVIVKENSLTNSHLYLIRHPKNRTPCLYRVNEKYCEEVVTVGDGFRSWFYGDSVVSDGLIRLFSPVHPLFLALPYFFDTKDVFKELEEIVCDPECPSITTLLKNEQFLKNIDKICDSKEVCDTKVFRFNENLTLEWIAGRFRRLRDALLEQGDLHKSILSNSDVLDRYSFGLLSDYMSPDLTVLAKAHLSIQDPVNNENERVDMSMKRKADESFEEIVQKQVKKPKESIVTKKLQQASKGTKSISHFFTKKA
uniref:RNase_H2-Ydr279 domain-containing protein n=1 Tax=Haemonchus contortus TaxID=6289 RepID=A0A7I4YJP5_HAECO